MASSKENLLAQVFLAIGHGAGNARLSEESVGWLFDRYSRWLDTKSDTGETPQQVWPRHGSTFLHKFIQIGQAIAGQAENLKPDPRGVQAAVGSVEGESDCPYCPSPKG